MKLGTHLSKPFNISRGIHQGSVLSPTLFNLVLDPLLSALKQRNLGLSINGLYLGVFSYADDIRTNATNFEDVTEQISTVDTVTKSRGLKLCPEKCALLSSGHASTDPLSITVAGTCFSVPYISLQRKIQDYKMKRYNSKHPQSTIKELKFLHANCSIYKMIWG